MVNRSVTEPGFGCYIPNFQRQTFIKKYIGGRHTNLSKPPQSDLFILFLRTRCHPPHPLLFLTYSHVNIKQFEEIGKRERPEFLSLTDDFSFSLTSPVLAHPLSKNNLRK